MIIIKEELIELTIKGKTNEEISKIFKTSKSTIKRNLKKFNIDKKFEINKEILRLCKIGKTNEEISKLTLISRRTIAKILRENNLNGINKFTARYKKPTEFQLSALIGTILGDSNLRSYNNKTANGSCNHVEKNLDYIIYKRKLFKGLVTDNIYSVQPKIENSNLQYGYRLISSPYLKKIYDSIYLPKRRITKYILLKYEAISLALHYQDDGSKCHNTYKISMMGFPKEDILLFSKFLYKKFNIKSTVHKSGDLYIRRSSSDLFKSLVKPYIVKSMKYKLY